ncbi:RDD family protein [Acidicapsa dinghuensis]|uniref:RDD family protein n=1 Tax=Acidicapsa dinghuensis TaxID=2218256 RepID=A0ABW1EKT0_9BACT|nr:RDD family protein [Acidicapsa dinghuensis]
MSKSATAHQQQIQPHFDEFDAQAAKARGAEPAWKQEVNQRLAAHRNRKPESQDANAQTNNAARPTTGRAAEAAARVAARYAKAPSYQQVLAGADAAVRAAGAAAEAARSAHAAAQAVLAGLESVDTQPQQAAASSRWQDQPPAQLRMEQTRVEQESPRLTPWSGAQSRWEDAVPVVEAVPEPVADVWTDMRVQPDPELNYRREEQHYYRRGNEPVEKELFTDEPFDEYRTGDAVSHATIEPVQHLPANLIEFPRELVATRKARPRRAEGPLYDPEHEDPQLNIFDIEPQMEVPVVVVAEAVAPPEWASIELDHPEQGYEQFAHVEAHPGYVYTRMPEISTAYELSAGAAAVAVEELPLTQQKAARPAENVAPESRIRNAVVALPEYELMVASWSDRLLALIVDGALVTLAFLAASMVVISATAHPPSGKFAMIAAICGWLVFAQVYQLLFLSYAEEGTPGMRYARIALCTFEDDNPTPAQMRKRIPAMLTSILPAGLGLMWALWDKDHLGWHDRMTKTYQRKY